MSSNVGRKVCFRGLYTTQWRVIAEGVDGLGFGGPGEYVHLSCIELLQPDILNVLGDKCFAKIGELECAPQPDEARQLTASEVIQLLERVQDKRHRANYILIIPLRDDSLLPYDAITVRSIEGQWCTFDGVDMVPLFLQP